MAMFEELSSRIGTIATNLQQQGYGGRQSDVLLLIAEVRAALHAQYGTIAAWENEELTVAEAFAKTNWLLAAVSAVEKSLLVSQLPEEEYWGGYSYTRPQVKRTPRVIRN